jgi:hypothetical protein
MMCFVNVESVDHYSIFQRFNLEWKTRTAFTYLHKQLDVIPELPQFDLPSRGCYDRSAGWSSLVARWAHNPKVGGSNPPPATNFLRNPFLQVSRILKVANRAFIFNSLVECRAIVPVPNLWNSVEQIAVDRLF